MRAYKTVNDAYIEPISFTVPRRAETFQSDIFPPAVGLKPACSARDWLSGKTALPPKIDLESVYDGNAPTEVAADYKPPASTPVPAEATKPPPIKAAEPTQAAAKAPPTRAEQKASIAAMANKFHDDDDEEEAEGDAETSSFEEIGRPAPRSSIPSRDAKPPSPTKTAPAQTPRAVASPTKSAPPPQQLQSPTLKRDIVPPAASSSAQGSDSSVQGSLAEIKQLLETQAQMLSEQGDKILSQSQQITQLVTDVETLEKRVISIAQDRSERIRQLELELEEARS
jgi:coronin-1B/1C/6